MREDRSIGQDIVVDKYSEADAAYQMTVRDYVMRVSTVAAGVAFDLTLPPVTEARGRLYSIRMRARHGTKDITIKDRGDSEGWADLTLNLAADATILYSDGMMWHKMSSVGSV